VPTGATGLAGAFAPPLGAEMVASGLEELACRARYELQCVSYPARPWVQSRIHNGEPVHNVVIVGGGQSGVAIAFGLMRERVLDVIVLDRNPAGQEGPWSTFARMHTLRTPKTVTGPDLGIPSLSPRSWYEARFGAQAWDKLGKIPRDLWLEYLLWVRETVGIAVRNETDVYDIESVAPGVLALHIRSATSGHRLPRLLARKIVLATGIEGSGIWQVPKLISDNLPRERYAHTADPIDFPSLAGQRVAVVGAGASAFDNAAVALEHGAASVDLLVRRPEIPKINPNRWIEFAGFMRHFADLSDPMKWRFMWKYFDMNQPPPQDTFDRCARFDNFHVHTGSPLTAVTCDGSRIVLTTPAEQFQADFLIVGTGHVIDFDARPELARVAQHIALWKDRYTPPASESNDALARYPYLGPGGEFTEREPGTAPHLTDITCFTYAAMPSLAHAAGISQLKFGVERIVTGITRSFFVNDSEAYFASLCAYDEQELVQAKLPDEETGATKVA
jgi:cation diffusion facilitator CzcD-associated flavoprotein CzcO